MKKKKLFTTGVVILCVMTIIFSLYLQDKKVMYGLSSGTYTLEGSDDAICPARITFNANTFTLLYDHLSSYCTIGKWGFKNKKVIATTDDGKYEYVFDVVDNDTLEFVQKGSSTITYIDEDINFNPPIADGSKFIYSDSR